VRRAKDGVKRLVLYKGVPVKIGRRTIYHVEYSDMLLLALLKRFRPALYREHVSTEAYAQIGNLTEAARIAGIDCATHYRKLEDPAYRAAFEAASKEDAQAPSRSPICRAAQDRFAFLRYVTPESARPQTLVRIRHAADALLIKPSGG
jgi:hypothetical protein